MLYRHYAQSRQRIPNPTLQKSIAEKHYPNCLLSATHGL